MRATWSRRSDELSGRDVPDACDVVQARRDYTNPVGTAFSIDTEPTSDGAGWSIYLVEATGSGSAVGVVQAICLK